MTNKKYNSRYDASRRDVLKGIASGLGVAAGASSVSATGIIEDQYLVDTQSADSDDWRDNVEIVAEVPEIGAASVRGTRDALQGIRHAPEIEYEIAPPETPDGVEPDSGPGFDDVSPEGHTGSGTPSPISVQWDKNAQNIADVHQAGITGDGARIAVVDSGLDADHPDLNVNRSLSANFSRAPSLGPGSDYHGTHVAGIAAATGDNASSGGVYAVGMAPDAELVEMKVFPYLSGASFLAAIRTAVDVGADVANMSFGPGSAYGPSIASDLNVELYRRIGEYALENGTVLVESAGNSDTNIDAVSETLTNSGKGSAPGFLQVSATGPLTQSGSFNFGNIAPAHMPAYYTNYGPDTIDVSAPGGNVLSNNFDGVLSTMPPDVSGGFTRTSGGLYGTLHGTSMAAPNVAGVVALVASQNPGSTPKQIIQHVRNTAQQIDTAYPDVFDLFGIDIGYFESTNGTVIGDFELEDPYESSTYRGQGHLSAVAAAGKGIPFPGGLEVNGTTYYPADPDQDGRYEDVNGDGTVDMEDARLLYQIALGSSPFDADSAFDFNNDGQFDIYDVQAFIRQFINR